MLRKKPKPILKPAAKAAPKPTPKRKHHSRLRRKYGKTSIPQLLMPLMGSEDIKLKFACTLCMVPCCDSSAVRTVVWTVALSYSLQYNPHSSSHFMRLCG